MRHEINIHWLVGPTTACDGVIILSLPVIQRVDYPFRPEIGKGWYEQVTVEENINVFKSVCRFRLGMANCLVPIGEVRADLHEPTFAVQILRRGITHHRESTPRAELIFRPGADFFRHADRLDFIPFLDSSSDNVMSGFSIAVTALARLMGEEIASRLLDTLHLSTAPAASVVAMPLHVTAPLRASMSPTLTGNLQKLFAQSKVLEYLCALSTHLDLGAVPAKPHSSKRDALMQLRDELVRLDGKIPSLDELAARYGMSARTLNNDFKQLFGKSIHSFLTNHRLDQAHAALQESGIAMKVLANRLGYSHVNHFITAFKRKFGYPPGSLRRRSGKRNPVYE